MYRLHCFGYPTLETPDGERVERIERCPKRFALLIYLACRRGVPCAQREALLPVFWPDADSEHARNTLRQALFQLRTVTEPDVVLGRDEGEVALSPDRFHCDLWDFLRHIREGDGFAARRMGPELFLRDFTVRDADPFMDWVDRTRSFLVGQAADALVVTALDAERNGRSAVARTAWSRALELSPHNEDLVCRLVTSAVASGDRAGAVEAWVGFQERLRVDLQLRPTARTRNAVERALAELAGPPPMGPLDSASRDDGPRRASWRRVGRDPEGVRPSGN